MDAQPTTPRQEFEILHDARPLRIESTPGTSRRLMVNFTSVGNDRHEWPPKELVGLASQGGRNHVICVTDISRCWMNCPGMDRKITTVISDYVLDNGITSIMAMGVSMGAYNALLLGRMMPLSRVIAFTPQYSVHPEIMPDEKRWWYFRRQIKNWPHREMNKLPAAPASIYVFHGDTPDEQMHWKRYGSAANLRHYIFAGSDHTFVAKLKESRALGKIVLAAINDKPGRMGKVVGRAGGMRRSEYDGYQAAKFYFEGRRKLPRPKGL